MKPAVGAGSKDAQRYRRRQIQTAMRRADVLLQDGRSVLVQRYLDQVDTASETALMFFDGEFSHAIRKGPLLWLDEGPTAQLFAPEEIKMIHRLSPTVWQGDVVADAMNPDAKSCPGGLEEPQPEPGELSDYDALELYPLALFANGDDVRALYLRYHRKGTLMAELVLLSAKFCHLRLLPVQPGEALNLDDEFAGAFVKSYSVSTHVTSPFVVVSLQC